MSKTADPEHVRAVHNNMLKALLKPRKSCLKVRKAPKQLCETVDLIKG